MGEQQVAKAWEHLCRASSDIEPNRHLHEILRLARNEVREKQLRGPLSGAMCLKTMAEVLRRTAEDVFETQWPEEGESWGSGADYKQRRYGAPRIFDGDRRAADQVLKSFWPAFGLHARWYVEGKTESGALEYVFGRNPSGIDLV